MLLFYDCNYNDTTKQFTKIPILSLVDWHKVDGNTIYFVGKYVIKS